jgi:hypothetical protein
MFTSIESAFNPYVIVISGASNDIKDYFVNDLSLRNDTIVVVPNKPYICAHEDSTDSDIYDAWRTKIIFELAKSFESTVDNYLPISENPGPYLYFMSQSSKMLTLSGSTWTVIFRDLHEMPKKQLRGLLRAALWVVEYPGVSVKLFVDTPASFCRCLDFQDAGKLRAREVRLTPG